MNLRSLFSSVGLLLILTILSGCAMSTVENVWMDDTYTGKVSNVMILAVTKNQAVRQIFEAEFTRQLEAKGVIAQPSFPLFHTDDVVGKEVIVAAATEKKVDSVIVAKLLDSKSYTERITDINRSNYGPNYIHSGRYDTYRRNVSWYGDYSSSYATVRNYDYEYIIAYVETGLYLLEGEKRIWTALTETESDGEDTSGSVVELVKLLVAQLEKDGLI